MSLSHINVNKNSQNVNKRFSKSINKKKTTSQLSKQRPFKIAPLQNSASTAGVREGTTCLISVLKALTMVKHVGGVPELFDAHELVHIVAPVQSLPVNV